MPKLSPLKALAIVVNAPSSAANTDPQAHHDFGIRKRHQHGMPLVLHAGPTRPVQPRACAFRRAGAGLCPGNGTARQGPGP